MRLTRRLSDLCSKMRLLVVCVFSYAAPMSVEGKRTHNCDMDEKRVWSCVIHPVSSLVSSQSLLASLAPYREIERKSDCQQSQNVAEYRFSRNRYINMSLRYLVFRAFDTQKPSKVGGRGRLATTARDWEKV